ncbi:Glutamate receptor ionotropic, delta-1 [Araneus ventricosus]|uniref:Glutamate receptor ionotropic, delta-1 n=1 Tax=Araneus ventricosus TaxID=182803 RepID=A0A4Y2PQB0_ARAVE|nr:Glutamate receptor ionotropic, delta-1 [Araneus ventricosus]
MERHPKTKVAVLSLPHAMSINISENGAMELGGFEGQFLQVVLEALEIEYEIIPEKENAFGHLQPNGTWTGIMGMMQRGDADLAFSHLTVTEERIRVANFSDVYTTTACVFATVMPENIKPAFGFLLPFDLTVWIAVLLTFCIMIVLFGIFQSKYSPFKIFFRLFANFSKQDSMPVDDSLKYKILLLTWLFFVTVITFSWSATLLSFIVEPIRDNMVRTFRELSKAVQKGTHKATFYNLSLPFLLNSEDEDLKRLGEIVVRNKWFVQASERGTGAQVGSRSVQAIHRNEAKLLFGNRDDVYISEDTLHVSPLAFAYGKTFCCPSKLNRILLRLSGAGLHEKLLRNSLLKVFLETPRKVETLTTESSLSITDLIGVFMLLGFGLIVSFVIFIGEVLFGNVFSPQK